GTAALVTVSTAFALCVLSIVALDMVRWDRVFNVPARDASQIRLSLLLLVLAIATTVPLAVIQRVQLAQQDGVWANVAALCGSGLAVAGVGLAALVHAPLAVFVAVVGWAPAIPLLLSGVLYASRNRQLIPGRRDLTLSAAGPLVRLGILFFILQITILVAYQS